MYINHWKLKNNNNKLKNYTFFRVNPTIKFQTMSYPQKTFHRAFQMYAAITPVGSCYRKVEVVARPRKMKMALNNE
jgi:hypothetical protein